MDYSKLLETSSTPLCVVRGSLCYRLSCRRKAMLICGNCRRVKYCSDFCLRRDKPRHFLLCETLKSLNLKEDSIPVDCLTWLDHKRTNTEYLKNFKIMFPGYSSNDLRLIRYEPYCSGCHRSQPQLLPHEFFIPCSACMIVCTCSKCMGNPFHYCDKYRLIASIELHKPGSKMNKRQRTITLEAKPNTNYMPLSALSNSDNWKEYWTKVFKFPGSISSSMDLIRASEVHSRVATIIAALEVVLPDLGTRDSLNLHFVNPTRDSLNASVVYEEILRILPRLSKLNCWFIGVDVPPRRPHISSSFVNPSAEFPNGINKIKTEYHVAEHLYDLYYSDVSLDKPDLIVAFDYEYPHCGSVGAINTLKVLMHIGCHTLFTSRYNTNSCDPPWIKSLEATGGNILAHGKNRWASRLPQLDIDAEREHAFLYQNDYWLITGPLLVTIVV